MNNDQAIRYPSSFKNLNGNTRKLTLNANKLKIEAVDAV